MKYEIEIRKEIANLESTEFPVEHNSGTFSAAEAHRAIGVGDPSFAEYTIYETPTGKRRISGCDPAKAPGHARGSRDSLNQAKARISELMATLKK